MVENIERLFTLFSCALVKILTFPTHSMKYIWFLPKTSKFSFDFILCSGYISEMGGAENAKTKIFSEPK